MLSIKLTDVMLTALAAFLSSTGRMDRNRSASPVTFFFFFFNTFILIGRNKVVAVVCISSQLSCSAVRHGVGNAHSLCSSVPRRTAGPSDAEVKETYPCLVMRILVTDNIYIVQYSLRSHGMDGAIPLAPPVNHLQVYSG
jgi:hypothetical protein